MPKIDFYVLPDANPQGRHLLACRLTEKAFSHGHRVYIYTESPAQSAMLDELLWTFRDKSFIPHALNGDPRLTDAPVVLGHTQAPPPASATVLINLGTTVPDFFESFERVTELVDQSEETKRLARERFRHYRERGFSPETHNL